ncbi:hypothetical protein CK501_05685 [Halovibrio salipaludis]|uniref:DUF6160 domain-containing protein n=1 Tax=Halovibrio salipaludis TaxID=2032626 RepID=A0A2A2F8L3_9GAMM|nr:DUF6160 family protein [Halovibrio salipaludis]PAU81054.1 hypothetical protein CK501_05685 [Halovibrio salipaludis]
MMTMKKSLLALSVASLPMAATADLQPMNDQDMGNVTGQQGVTIELSTAATIDQVEYSQSTADADTGSLLIDGIRIGGHDDGESLDIDVNVDLITENDDLGRAPYGADPGNVEDGDAYISVRNLGNEPTPVEAGVDLDRLGLASSDDDSSATLISDFTADFWVSQLDITARVNNQIADGNEDTGSIRIRNVFHADIGADFDVAAVSLPSIRMAGADQLENLKGDAGDLNRNALAVTGVTVNAEIGAGPALSTTAGIDGAPDNTLRVDINELTTSIWMPTVNVGSGDGTTASIGNVGISNLNIADTQMAIYGRE